MGDDRITVEIPGVYDANAVLEDLGSPGSLYFIVQKDSDGNENYSYDSSTGTYKLNYDIQNLIDNGSVIMDGNDVKSANAAYNQSSSTSTKEPSLKCPIKQRSPSLKIARSMPMRQQHLPNCWPTPLWPNSSKILQRTYKPLYINSDSFPIGKTAAVCF